MATCHASPLSSLHIPSCDYVLRTLQMTGHAARSSQQAFLRAPPAASTQQRGCRPSTPATLCGRLLHIAGGARVGAPGLLHHLLHRTASHANYLADCSRQAGTVEAALYLLGAVTQRMQEAAQAGGDGRQQTLVAASVSRLWEQERRSKQLRAVKTGLSRHGLACLGHGLRHGLLRPLPPAGAVESMPL